MRNDRIIGNIGIIHLPGRGVLPILRTSVRRAYTNGQMLPSRAGTSPTVWTRGLACLGLAGTRGLAGPIEELPSFKMSPSLPRSEQ